MSTFNDGLMKAAGVTLVTEERLAALEAFWAAFKDEDLHITADPYDDDQAAAWDRFYAAVRALDALEDQQPAAVQEPTEETP